MPCRINRRRMITARIVLESQLHEHSVFATLTYDDLKRVTSQYMNLIPKDLQHFMKRVRFAYQPHKLRFYGVGEYGSKNERPHYHVALFGASLLEHSFDIKTGLCNGGPIFNAWPLGNVHLGELNEKSASYLAGYVTKKMTGVNDVRLNGRHPEFARMSLRPGLGQGAVRHMAAGLTSLGGAAVLADHLDVPREVRIEGKKYPMGAYLRRELRKEVGWSEKAPMEVRYQIAVEKSFMTDDEVRAEEARRKNAEATALARTQIDGSKKTL